ncbi:mitochondrial ribosome-associated GTPase 1-like isoform X1 [Hydractinia symbiolongicarpus]|uniref:mitochondrial ribosome-associated GTPase 1-like isoform X1 n=2 Tax=Hydractinia symbiolongicarpus TaxID=13093 RepID=UPI00254D2643|nr:mitochondrial ribosome-associated GTPase 1-like isoform X1 [Hydractinia symbiolongicarpus]
MASRPSFKFPIYFLPDIFHRVLPFHMAKGMRAMRGIVNNCDCVIEIRDARVPFSSTNPQFEDLYANKPRIILMNKIDIADEKKTKEISNKILKDDDADAVLFSNCNARFNHAIKQVMPVLKQIFTEQNRVKSEQCETPVKGLHERQYKVIVCGIPNVGKSSFINSARRHFMSKGGKATPVGKKPGVTRSVMQSIKMSQSPRILLLDTPGISYPEVQDSMTGIKLALIGTFPDHVIGEEVIADYLLYALNKQKNTRYLKMCALKEPCDDFDKVIYSLAEQRDLISDSRPDYRRCSILLIQAFRNGRFGRITLDET